VCCVCVCVKESRDRTACLIVFSSDTTIKCIHPCSTHSITFKSSDTAHQLLWSESDIAGRHCRIKTLEKLSQVYRRWIHDLHRNSIEGTLPSNTGWHAFAKHVTGVSSHVTRRVSIGGCFESTRWVFLYFTYYTVVYINKVNVAYWCIANGRN